MQTVEQPLWRKLAWFLALWVGGVLALGVVAGVLKLVIHN
ncbi:DUF2474 family protein [Acetobacter indonesiensis]|uniref:DUF2474 domain-containing protein n=1 Tax=Acetobacter indonesiensis TaxID=104101 RepID=A0A6N3T5X5_9PROT|nr:DUF2474 family protein [Acetobacter indonesiensis]MCG0994304.1 DUF2474 domain-containing protein [Acetobacter indonesiensis]MCP1229579.1 DUF2474 domain-containing protein [Acetobacter indonesiensis]GAN62420.1 hypothetical protein Abin_007_110 [Acetobacter indonesiensis]GBQ53984.1 hypothetical protein AA0313_0431 [Acetobacter indonesiensis NRIC 0313]GEN03304.1 hypothetical protein AIN02nite_13290 [Acetobacter indonesiensis]